ncbi:UNVERIFIED_CONTAM: hypothetical protein Sradi_0131300 [Sesamum radiatum]|uniref:Uncharacterized protein n=1 Tax=Sesamum radiatum TaxID=300843 RepID=A0AAW2WJ98_SESRA
MGKALLQIRVPGKGKVLYCGLAVGLFCFRTIYAALCNALVSCSIQLSLRAAEKALDKAAGKKAMSSTQLGASQGEICILCCFMAYTTKTIFLPCIKDLYNIIRLFSLVFY